MNATNPQPEQMGQHQVGLGDVLGWAILDDHFRSQFTANPTAALEASHLQLTSEDTDALTRWARWWNGVPSDTAIVAGKALVDDTGLGERILADGIAAVEDSGFSIAAPQLDKIKDVIRPYFMNVPDVMMAAGQAVLDTSWAEKLLDNPDDTLSESGYSISKEREKEFLLEVVRKQLKEAPDVCLAAGRALLDADWADKFLDNPAGTLRDEGYDLLRNEVPAVIEAARLQQKPAYDVWIVLGRLLLDSEFEARIKEDANTHQALVKAGYFLQQEEIHQVMSLLPALSSAANDEQEFMRQIRNYPHELFKKTMDSATRTYKTISRMSAVMFMVGIALFIASAIYGAVEKAAVAFLFGGLGVATFVSFFLIDPIDRSQRALTNLVQVQMGFISFNEQFSILHDLRSHGVGGRGQDPERFERVSDILEKRTSGSMELLQRFITAPQKRAAEEEAKEIDARNREAEEWAKVLDARNREAEERAESIEARNREEEEGKEVAEARVPMSEAFATNRFIQIFQARKTKELTKPTRQAERTP
jgi:hypothetical protein